MIILIFGQPASGKTTLAHEIKRAQVFYDTILIDGDRWRDITKNKDFSKQGRVYNLRGAFNMALFLEKEGYTPILSFVTPYQELRDYLKDNAEDLIQVYLEYNEDRGRNNNFAKDFEEPIEGVLRLNTSEASILNCYYQILKYVYEEKSRRQHAAENG